MWVWVRSGDPGTYVEVAKALAQEVEARAKGRLVVLFLFVTDRPKAVDAKLLALSVRAPGVAIARLSPSNPGIAAYKLAGDAP